MSLLRDRVVAVLLVLVLAASALTAGLALTRSEASGVGLPPDPAGVEGPAYEPADLVGPGGDALDALVDAMPSVLGYDHRDLDGAEAAAVATMTRRYAGRFREAFDLRVRPYARRREAVAEAVVRGAGVVRTDGDDTVVCLAYVDQLLVEATRLRGGRPEVLGWLRLRVTMVRRGETWLVDGLQTV